MEPTNTVEFETVTLCGFDVPVFRGAQPIPADIIDQLKQPLPADAISTNNDPKKKGLSSIKSIYIVERLNQVFGLGQWVQLAKFVEKVTKPEGSGKGDSVVLKSILVVPKYGIYFEAYGGNDNYDPGDAYKGACTDALTKMAGFMYVGMDVFKGHPETSKAAPKAAAPIVAPKAATPVTAKPTDAGNFATMPAHSDQAPAKSTARLINATEKRAFWSAVKTSQKSEQAVRDYFGSVGITSTAEMNKTNFDAAMKWACGTERKAA
jgi:hypothetical protein